MHSNADYRGLQELSPDGVIVVRSDCTIFAVNDNLVALFGYNARDLCGLPVEFLLPSVGDLVRQMLASDGDKNPHKNELLEYWVQDATGSTLAVDVMLASVRAFDLREPLVCISVRDATARKKTEQVLEEIRIRSERTQSDLLHLSNTLPLVIFQWESDESGNLKYTFMGARLQEVMGISVDQVMSDPALLFATLAPEDRLELMAHIAEALAKVRAGEPQASFSMALRAHRNSRLRWLRYSAMYAGRRVNERTIWNGYLEDITQRKKAEEDKELATLQFRTLWEKSPDTYLFLGGQQVLSCNAAALDFFGVSRPDALLGHALTEPAFCAPTQPDGHASRQLFDDVLDYASSLSRNGSCHLRAPPAAGLRVVRGSVKFEWHLLRQNSGAFVADIVVTPMQIDAHDGYLLICQDVTLQRQAQNELVRAKQAAEDMARTKADFLANISHEIRTPMNAIVGLSHLVLQSELNPAQHNFLEKIQDSGQRLLGIINDILDFSRMDAGTFTIEAHDFHLATVLDKVLAAVGDKARAKGLGVLLDIDPQVPNALHGDASRLGQVLGNYANNAVKFTAAGAVCIAVMPASLQAHQVKLRFEVRDTGIGLTDAQKARLFQSFQQADTSTTRQHGGTGLGLAICKSLAELMHGEVGVSSEAGKGSTFWFTAQLERCQSQPPAQNTKPVLAPVATNAPAIGAALPGATPGFAPAQGLRRVMGKEAVYAQMLRKFINGHCDGVVRIRSALNAQDWASAERAAHTLKGVAGNIGAVQIQADAGRLEEALRKHPPEKNLAALLHAADTSLGRLIAHLRAYMPQETEVPASADDASRLISVVGELRALLEQDDSCAIDLFSSNTALLKYAYPTRFETLEAALANYDFPAALQCL